MATLTLTATPHPELSPPAVRLDVTATGSPTVTSVTVTRTDQSGKTYPVRTSDGGPLVVSGGSATVWDPEIPYGLTSTYSVSATGATTVTASASLDVAVPWFVHVSVPALSMPLPVVSEIGELSRPIDRGVFQIIGRADPILITGGARSTPAGRLSVRTTTDAQRTALDLLLDDGSALLLNVPASLNWGMSTCYIAIGDVTTARTVDFAEQPWREWTLPYQVVGRPAGGSQSLVTHQTVYDSYGGLSWSAQYAAAGSPTWAQLANPIT